MPAKFWRKRKIAMNEEQQNAWLQAYRKLIQDKISYKKNHQ